MRSGSSPKEISGSIGVRRRFDREIGEPARRVDQLGLVQRERERVDREVAAQEVGLDVVGERHLGLAALRVVHVRAERRDLEGLAVLDAADGAEALALQPDGVGPARDDALDGVGPRVGRDVDVVAAVVPVEERVAHAPPTRYARWPSARSSPASSWVAEPGSKNRASRGGRSTPAFSRPRRRRVARSTSLGCPRHVSTVGVRGRTRELALVLARSRPCSSPSASSPCPGTFFMLSFAAGALVACLLALRRRRRRLGVGRRSSSSSGVALAALVPIGRRIEREARARAACRRDPAGNGRRAVVLAGDPGRAARHRAWCGSSGKNGGPRASTALADRRRARTSSSCGSTAPALIVRALETFEEQRMTAFVIVARRHRVPAVPDRGRRASASCGRTSAASSSGSGKYHATVDPGLRLIFPFIDKMQLVDMREQVVDVPPQEVITSDNVVVSVDAVIYYEATDPQRSRTTWRTSSSRRRSSRRRTCATSSATCSSTMR